jgi:hypothetical protein
MWVVLIVHIMQLKRGTTLSMTTDNRIVEVGSERSGFTKFV